MKILFKTKDSNPNIEYGTILNIDMIPVKYYLHYYIRHILKTSYSSSIWGKNTYMILFLLEKGSRHEDII